MQGHSSEIIVKTQEVFKARMKDASPSGVAMVAQAHVLQQALYKTL